MIIEAVHYTGKIRIQVVGEITSMTFRDGRTLFYCSGHRWVKSRNAWTKETNAYSAIESYTVEAEG